MNELDPKVKELIKEHQEAESKALKLRTERNTWIVKLRDKGFSYKELSYYFKLSQTRVKYIIRRLKRGKGQG